MVLFAGCACPSKRNDDTSIQDRQSGTYRWARQSVHSNWQPMPVGLAIRHLCHVRVQKQITVRRMHGLCSLRWVSERTSFLPVSSIVGWILSACIFSPIWRWSRLHVFLFFFYWIIRDVQGVETFFQRVFLEVILFSDATNFFDLFAVIIFEAAKKYSVDSRALHFQFRRIIERAEQ